jgi:dihydroorotase
MKTLIQNAHIIQPASSFHHQRKDILIENGVIKEVADKIELEADEVISGSDLHVSTGWFDLRADYAEPGFEHRETFESGSVASKAGGFTGVVLMPNTHPTIDSKSQVEFVKKMGSFLPIEVFAAGSISVGTKGKDLAELYDMHQAGAVAFTDGFNSIQDADLVKRALYYSQSFDGVIMLFPHNESIAHAGMMNEGPMSTKLGLKSAPALAESLNVNRDLFIAEYCNAPVHISCISSSKSVELIRDAKAKGIKVTCDVAVANLVFTDSVLETFDSTFKVLPHLRDEEDRQALIQGINDGTIDAIVTNHRPWNIEEKECEFDHAEFGMACSETAFNLLRNATIDVIEVETLVKALSENPRSIVNQTVDSIEIGNKSNITVFDPYETGKTETKRSLSYKVPGIGKPLKGTVKAAIC